MTLFDRSRAPLTEKFDSMPPPDAKFVCPLASALTPGADVASVKMLRLKLIGSSATRVVSKRTPTSALVVLMIGASARTSIASVSAAGRSSTSTTASWLTASVRPERT